MPNANEFHSLVAAAKRGDAKAWSRIVVAFTPLVRSVARRSGIRVCDVEDVVQTTWVKALRHIRGLLNPEALPGWLRSIAKRESLALLLSSQREVPSEDVPSLPDLQGSPLEEQLIADERAAALRAAIQRLPGRQQSVMLALMGSSSSSYTTVAGQLSMPIGSIGPTRLRSLERLRTDEELVGVLAA